MDLPGARDYIIGRLTYESNPNLFYHSVAHTLDVYHSAGRLAVIENIDPKLKIIIETAALYHDAGMLSQYDDHEASSVILACNVLPRFDYPASVIDQIAALIMVTKLPQQAVSLPEQIICDADLDYLGREDFFIHSFQLQLEWNLNGVRKTDLREWLGIQINFLSSHRYFTSAASKLRNEGKEKNLTEIRQILNIFE
jgi:predicted metal-dependent HD superfamily phosphohydrolase